MGITNRAKESIFAGFAFFVVRASFHGPRLRFPIGVTVIGLLPASVIIFGPSLVGYPAFGGEGV